MMIEIPDCGPNEHFDTPILIHDWKKCLKINYVQLTTEISYDDIKQIGTPLLQTATLVESKINKVFIRPKSRYVPSQRVFVIYFLLPICKTPFKVLWLRYCYARFADMVELLIFITRLRFLEIVLRSF